MSAIAVIQARMSSSRFPGKVLADLDGLPMAVFMARRMGQCKLLDRVVIATSDEVSDDPLAQAAIDHGLNVFRGPLNDVLGRFAMVQAIEQADVIVRMTADCPLCDWNVIDNLIQLRNDRNADYASNIDPRTFPHGLDCEVFTAATLSRAQASARNDYDREHVTTWMRSNNAALIRTNLLYSKNRSALRLTVDHPADLDLVRAIIAGVGVQAGLDDIVAWADAHPEVTARNAAHRVI